MAQPIPNVSSGTIKRLEDFPSKFVDARNIDVWLPEGYNAEKKYCVLYIHDGQMLFDGTTTWNKEEWGVDETMSRLIANHQIKDCIVVGVWNTGKRHLEYFPQKAFYCMGQDDQQRVLAVSGNTVTHLMGRLPVSDNYLKFLVEELKPCIDSNFSTLSNQENTFVAGSSMGGVISMYAICEYPDVFGGAACLSTHWPGIDGLADNPVPATFLNYFKTEVPSPHNHRIYFDYGSKTLDALYKPFQLQADAIMQSSGYTRDVNWVTKEFPGDDHSENSWNRRLATPILFLLKK